MRNAFCSLVLFFALSFVLASCRGSADPVAMGKAAFQSYGCYQCHTIGNTGGQGIYGPDLTYIGFRKTPDWLDLWLKDPQAWKKNTTMPNFKLPEPVRASLVAYLSAQKGQAFDQSGKPWDKPQIQQDLIAKGKVIYDRVGCVGCHGKDGVGGWPNNNVVGAAIPSLTRVADGYSKEELKERIYKGRVPDPADFSKPAPMIHMPAWGEVLNEDELDALVEYLYSLRPTEDSDVW